MDHGEVRTASPLVIRPPESFTLETDDAQRLLATSVYISVPLTEDQQGVELHRKSQNDTPALEASDKEPSSTSESSASFSAPWCRKSIAMQQMRSLHVFPQRPSPPTSLLATPTDAPRVHSYSNSCATLSTGGDQAFRDTLDPVGANWERATAELHRLACVLRRLTGSRPTELPDLTSPQTVSSKDSSPAHRRFDSADVAAYSTDDAGHSRPLHHTDSSSEASHPHRKGPQLTAHTSRCQDHPVVDPRTGGGSSSSKAYWLTLLALHPDGSPSSCSGEGGGITPLTVLSDMEMMLMLNFAFHCPVKPVARLFRNALRCLEARGVITHSYRELLLMDGHGYRSPSLPVMGNDMHSNWIATSRAPTPSYTLLELSQYLDVLDTSIACWSLPRQLAHCPVMLEAAALRNRVVTDIFLETGELCHYHHLMSTFPTILAAHDRTMRFLLFDPEGPLHVEERLHIAIMSAARHRCEYLVRRFALALMAFAPDRGAAHRFLSEGPGPALRTLQPLIATLAHQPWQLSRVQLETVLRHPETEWSVSRLVHAVSVITTVLSLSGLTISLSVPTEISTAILPASLMPLRQVPPLRLAERTAGAQSADDLAGLTGSTDASNSCWAPSNPGTVGHHHHSLATIDFVKYCGVDTVASQPRITRGGGSQSFNEAAFSWEDRAGAMVEQYYPQYADLLTEEIAAVDAVTRSMDCCGMVVKDRAQFEPSDAWRSLRMYLLNLIGIVADDFPYQSINSILTRGVKTFVQKSFAYPERLCLLDLGDWSLPVAPSNSKADASSEAETLTTSPTAATATTQPRDASDRRWLHDEVTVLLVSLVTFENRREGLMLMFLNHLQQYLRSA